jgi:LysR family positive regulator for ilvC
MVALGLGVGVVPELVLQSSPLASKVKVIDVQPPLRPYAVGLCAQASNLDNELLKAFWSCAKSAYQLS